MKKVIANKFPNFTICNYDNVNNMWTVRGVGKNGKDLTIPVTMMTTAQKGECNEAYQKIVVSWMDILNCSKNYAQYHLANAYLTNKSKYPDTEASALLQITSIKTRK